MSQDVFVFWMRQTIASDFVMNIVAGIAGSVMTWVIVGLRRWISRRAKFADYAGWYEHFTNEGHAIEGERTKLTWLGGNIIKAEHDNPGNAWVSYITLNESVPSVGTGHYQYIGKDDCGIHHIQRHLSKAKIFVFLTNTSEGTGRTMSYVWKRST